MARLREVGPEFVATAPTRWVFEGMVAAERERVFAAISADPKTWRAWFPGFTDGGYEDEPGLGARRWVRVGGTTFRETMIAWNAPATWTYRVDETTVPLAHALVEEWAFEPDGGSTFVRWTFAMEPRLLFRLASPVAPRLMRALFARAMRNLSGQLAR